MMKSEIVFHDLKMDIPVKTGFVVRAEQNYNELHYVVYDAPYCWLYFAGNKKYRVENVTLQQMMDNLPEGRFFQCNRSTIINVYHCRDYNRTDAVVVMNDDTEHRLSRRRAKDFFSAVYNRSTK